MKQKSFDFLVKTPKGIANVSVIWSNNGITIDEELVDLDGKPVTLMIILKMPWKKEPEVFRSASEVDRSTGGSLTIQDWFIRNGVGAGATQFLQGMNRTYDQMKQENLLAGINKKRKY